MNRRGFFGALAALGGAAAARRLIDPAPIVSPPQELPVGTSGYSQWVNADLNGKSYTITTNAAVGSVVYIDYEAHMRGEGVKWNYTASS